MQHSTSNWLESNDLPSSIWLIVRDYLDGIEYWRFLSTSKELFSDVKKETRRIRLIDEADIYKFYEKAAFREKILQKIVNLYQQLTLCTSNPKFTRFPPRCSITLVNVSTDKVIHHLAKFSNRKIVDIYFKSKKTDEKFIFPCPENVHSLILHYCLSIEGFSSIDNIRELSLFSCRSISDTKDFSNLSKLSIDYNPIISDISCLGNIYDLTLRDCPNIEDISSLVNNHSITILNCVKARFHVCLLRAHRLKTDLQGFPSELPADIKTRHLEIRDKSFEEMRLLCSLSSLTIKGFPRLTTLRQWEGLEKIRCITFMECSRLIDLQGLAGQDPGREQERKTRWVELSGCGQIDDFASLTGLTSLKLFEDVVRTVLPKNLQILSTIPSIFVNLHPLYNFFADDDDENDVEEDQNMVSAFLAELLKNLVRAEEIQLEEGQRMVRINRRLIIPRYLQKEIIELDVMKEFLEKYECFPDDHYQMINYQRRP